jgi:signal transduction histidine kinase
MVAIRSVGHFSGSRSLVPALLLVGLFAAYYAFEPFLSARARWHMFIYLPVQTGVVVLMTLLQPYQDVTAALYILLCLQVVRSFSPGVAFSLVGLYVILLTVTQILGVGLIGGLGLSFLMLAVGTFVVSGDRLYFQTYADEGESLRKLMRLKEAHQQLQESAARAEELAAARERNRLARELHDSVSQMIFSITLVARATQILLERDPSQVAGQLDRLQEMTGTALGQLRSLITQMRPPHN